MDTVFFDEITKKLKNLPDNLKLVVAICIELIFIFTLYACTSPAKPSPFLAPTAGKIIIQAKPTLTPAQESAPTQPLPVHSPTPSPTQTQLAAFPISGAWTGSAKNGSTGMQVTIILQPSCQVGKLCGTYNLSLPCSGDFTLVGEKDCVYEFHARYFHDEKANQCSGRWRFVAVVSMPLS